MVPLYDEPHYTLRFADDRIISRVHLEGVEAVQRVSVYKIDPGSGERLGLPATATVGESGWGTWRSRSSCEPARRSLR